MKKLRTSEVNPRSFLLVGVIITSIVLIVTIVGIFWTPYSPTAMKYGRFSPPSWAHIFGTDNFGRDIFSRIVKGMGNTISIAVSTVLIGAVFGIAIGAITGYMGGMVDEVLMRINDTLTAFPSFLLALLIVSIIGPGSKYSVVIALGIVFIPSFARVTRSEYSSLMNRRLRSRSSLSSFMRASILAWIVTSRALTGSSAMRNLGLWIRAAAMLTRCLWPPERSSGLAFQHSCGSLTRSSISWTRLFLSLASYFPNTLRGSSTCHSAVKAGFSEL